MLIHQKTKYICVGEVNNSVDIEDGGDFSSCLENIHRYKNQEKQRIGKDRKR